MWRRDLSFDKSADNPVAWWRSQQKKVGEFLIGWCGSRRKICRTGGDWRIRTCLYHMRGIPVSWPTSTSLADSLLVTPSYFFPFRLSCLVLACLICFHSLRLFLVLSVLASFLWLSLWMMLDFDWQRNRLSRKSCRLPSDYSRSRRSTVRLSSNISGLIFTSPFFCHFELKKHRTELYR